MKGTAKVNTELKAGGNAFVKFSLDKVVNLQNLNLEMQKVLNHPIIFNKN